jgi:hypothetical protein
MPEIGTSGLMSGDGKRGGARRQYPRPSSTLPGFSLPVNQGLSIEARSFAAWLSRTPAYGAATFRRVQSRQTARLF